MPKIHHSVHLRALALAATCALAGCTSGPMPYQQRTGGDQTFGYSDVKVDALHYSVAYSANRAEDAENYLELRAAQIARNAGFEYFLLENRGANSLKFTENALQPKQMSGGDTRNGRSSDFNSMVPESYTMKVEIHFNAWAQMTLMTAEQAAGNPKAMQVAQVLERSGSNLKP